MTLDSLFNLMKNGTDADWHKAGLPVSHGERDWTSLPTFGGDEPADTIEVWSWDANRLIVGTCQDDIEIVQR